MNTGLTGKMLAVLAAVADAKVIASDTDGDMTFYIVRPTGQPGPRVQPLDPTELYAIKKFGEWDWITLRGSGNPIGDVQITDTGADILAKHWPTRNH